MSLHLVPGSVLVGVDDSTGGDLALDWAAEHARHRRRPLTIVHAAGTPVVTDFAIDLADAEEGLLAAGRRVTDRALERVRAEHPSLEVSGQVLIGDPRSVLARLAADASVLVLGSRGRGALASLLLGSVSVALAAHAPCPVVVVRPGSDPLAPADRPVVVGVDGDEDAAGALTLGFELAAAQGRSLEVVHAVGGTTVFPYPDAVVPEIGERLSRAADQLLAESLEGYAAAFPDVVVRRRPVQETPTQALVAASRTASVVVVGCRGRSTARSYLLGSVSRAVIEQARCTVAVVRPPVV